MNRLKEEFSKDVEKLKGKPLKEKIQYFIMYYKIPFLLIVSVIAIIISFIYSRMQYREYAFHAYFFNAQTAEKDEIFSRELEEFLGVDTKKEIVSLDSSLQLGGNSQLSIASTEKFSVEMFNGIVDACIMPEEIFLAYVEQGCFQDLRNCLSEAQLTEYADLLIYENEIPIGVKTGSFSKLESAGLYTEEDTPIFGILGLTEHITECSEFLKFLDS